MDYSENTVKSYRDAFTIFLRYCTKVLNLKPEKMKITDINKDFIEDFLNWLVDKKRILHQNTESKACCTSIFFPISTN